MQIRPLEPRDAEPMMEWMHDPEAAGLLAAPFAEKTREDCLAFIAAAGRPGPDRHRAIADENGEYMGTVSLKQIDPGRGTAEFAIATRREAWGRGYGAFAMREALRAAFGEEGLTSVYWYVNRENRRAIRFYEKQGFTPLSAPPAGAPAKEAGDPRMIWFEAKAPRGEDEDPRTERLGEPAARGEGGHG